MPISDQSSSFNKEKKAQINGSFEGVVDSKLSAIQNLESSSSKEEISSSKACKQNVPWKSLLISIKSSEIYDIINDIKDFLFFFINCWKK